MAGRRDLYQAWLGCSQAQDAADCLTGLGYGWVHSADWLVVDHYGLDTSWESQLLNELAGDKGTPSSGDRRSGRSASSGGSAAGSEFLRCGHRPALSEWLVPQPLPPAIGPSLRPLGA